MLGPARLQALKLPYIVHFSALVVNVAMHNAGCPVATMHTGILLFHNGPGSFFKRYLCHLSNLIISLLPPCHITIASTSYLYCLHISNQVPVPDQSSGSVASTAAHCRLQLATTGPSCCLLVTYVTLFMHQRVCMNIWTPFRGPFPTLYGNVHIISY